MKRASVVLMLALVAAVAARVAAPAHQRQAGFSAALACGVERWTVKTLKDRPLLLRGAADHRRVPDEPPAPDLPSGSPARARAPDLQPHRQRHAQAQRGRPRLPPRPPQRLAHDDRRDSLAALHEGSDRHPAQADDRGTQRRKSLRQGSGGRRRLLRLPPRSDGRRSERDRAPSRSRLRLLVEGRATPASASAEWEAGSALPRTRPSVSGRRRPTSTAATSRTATSACAGTWLILTRTTSTATTTASAARARTRLLSRGR